MDFFENFYGIRIKRCCASCKFKQMDNRTRLCRIGAGVVSPSSVCPMWACTEGLLNAGSGNGAVKRREYLAYCLERISRVKVIGNAVHTHDSLSDIRRDFERENGTIYMMRK